MQNLAGALCALAICVLPEVARAQGAVLVPTFHSAGIRWSPTGGSSSSVGSVRYRVSGDSVWQQGLPLWFDDRSSPNPPYAPEYRGSLVGLSPDTVYDIELSGPGLPTELISTKTWSETFPIARTIEVGTSSSTLIADQSGTIDGYVLYTSPFGQESTIDVGNRADYDVIIRASYVIVRGLVLKGAGKHAVLIGGQAPSDIVIEECDISGWGRIASDGFGVDLDSGISSSNAELTRLIVQRNRIHHPRSDSNSWAEFRTVGNTYHPQGPQAVSLFDTLGNHVIRYNHIYSDDQHYFNDGIGGGDNFSYQGSPHRDSDIYGNWIDSCWDNPIESEGANLNVRIFGNTIDLSYSALGIAATSLGPLYIYRNVIGRSRKGPPESTGSWDDDPRGRFIKAGNDDIYRAGRIYVFHNTVLQPAPPAGEALPTGVRSALDTSAGPASDGGAYNLVSRNNIFQVPSTDALSIQDDSSGAAAPPNDFDYDLYNGLIQSPVPQEAHGWLGVPNYDASNPKGTYFLAAGSLGIDSATPLAGFNQDFIGAGPDVGAYETGGPPLVFGVDDSTDLSRAVQTTSSRETKGCGCHLVGRTPGPGLLWVFACIVLSTLRGRRAWRLGSALREGNGDWRGKGDRDREGQRQRILGCGIGGGDWLSVLREPRTRRAGAEK